MCCSWRWVPWLLAEISAIVSSTSLMWTQGISDNAVLTSFQHFPNKEEQTTHFLNTQRPRVFVLSGLDAELGHTIIGPEEAWKSPTVYLTLFIYLLLHPTCPLAYTPTPLALEDSFMLGEAKLLFRMNWLERQLYVELKPASGSFYSLVLILVSPRNLICYSHD